MSLTRRMRPTVSAGDERCRSYCEEFDSRCVLPDDHDDEWHRNTDGEGWVRGDDVHDLEEVDA